jgi:hypothetical protein
MTRSRKPNVDGNAPISNPAFPRTRQVEPKSATMPFKATTSYNRQIRLNRATGAGDYLARRYFLSTVGPGECVMAGLYDGLESPFRLQHVGLKAPFGRNNLRGPPIGGRTHPTPGVMPCGPRRGRLNEGLFM